MSGSRESDFEHCLEEFRAKLILGKLVNKSKTRLLRFVSLSSFRLKKNQLTSLYRLGLKGFLADFKVLKPRESFVEKTYFSSNKIDKLSSEILCLSPFLGDL